MASKQDNYLRMHHPSIYKGMKKGGKVEYYENGGLAPNIKKVDVLRSKTSGFDALMAQRDTNGSKFKSIIPGDTTGVDTSLLSGYKPLTPPTSLLPSSSYKPLERPKSIIPEGKAKGGKMKKKNKYYAKGGKNTDTVPAMLTPGEVVLNAEQQEALGELVGMKPAALFEKIGIPGFAGGGMATKEDALMQYYENGGTVDNLRMDRHTLLSMGIEDPSSKTTPGEISGKFADLPYTPYGKTDVQRMQNLLKERASTELVKARERAALGEKSPITTFDYDPEQWGGKTGTYDVLGKNTILDVVKEADRKKKYYSYGKK